MKSLVTLLALLFLAVPCAAAPQSAGGEAKALASFKKAFHPKKAAPVPARQQALTSLASFGSAKVAEARAKVPNLKNARRFTLREVERTPERRRQAS